MELSFIIVTYNSLKLISGCIGSVINSVNLLTKDYEIIVVDNSNGGQFKLLENEIKTNFGDTIKLIHNTQNGGYGQGNNIGIREAKGRIVCVMNPDVLFLTQFFKQALALFKKDSRLAMVGGKQIGGLNISFWNRTEYDFFIITAPLSIFLNKINLYIERYFYLSGAMLLIDREKFMEIGLFDENIFLYCEEADITQRFRNKNYKTIFRKDFRYKHLVDGRNDTSENSFKALMQSSKIYLEKYHYSFQNFLSKKIVSYRLMTLLYRWFGKTEKSEQSKDFLERFRKISEDLQKNDNNES